MEVADGEAGMLERGVEGKVFEAGFAQDKLVGFGGGVGGIFFDVDLVQDNDLLGVEGVGGLSMVTIVENDSVDVEAVGEVTTEGGSGVASNAAFGFLVWWSRTCSWSFVLLGNLAGQRLQACFLAATSSSLCSFSHRQLGESFLCAS